MALTLTVKLLIGALTLAVIGAITATIVIVVQDDDSPTTTEYPDTDGIDLTTVQGPEGENTPEATEPNVPAFMPYEVGVGIADMTGPCVEITFVSRCKVLTAKLMVEVWKREVCR